MRRHSFVGPVTFLIIVREGIGGHYGMGPTPKAAAEQVPYFTRASIRNTGIIWAFGCEAEEIEVTYDGGWRAPLRPFIDGVPIREFNV